ncbi:MAG: hypothetical protein PVF68_09885 [Acidobacteriota bacterium]|jgi:hypothetical protein
MVVRSIGVLSCGKILGILYAAIGLLVGMFFSLFALVGGFAGALQGEPGGAILSFVFGVGAVFLLPIVYGIMGFLGGVITAVIYNLAAGAVGGLEVELEPPRGRGSAAGV